MLIKDGYRVVGFYSKVLILQDVLGLHILIAQTLTSSD